MTSLIDRVVPNSLNYTDIKPESIESEIKLVKFQPTATITGARGGDMVKFLLSGNGFYDPYSAYMQFTVECSDIPASKARFLDRSAHSFISRMVIRSQGVEIERIENYDVVAALINDMIYSPEQNAIHHWEGFPTQTINSFDTMTSEGVLINLSEPVKIIDPADASKTKDYNFDGCGYNPTRRKIIQSFHQGASPLTHGYFGETAFYNTGEAESASQRVDTNSVDTIMIKDQALSEDKNLTKYDILDIGVGQDTNMFPLDFACHVDGVRQQATKLKAVDSKVVTVPGQTKLTFIIPIYSGIIGLLMPDKKLLPLNLLPLDIEITFNQHALYGSTSDAGRNYVIKEFNLFSHMIFFEQDIHRSLEAAVAEHGIFIYCNSFHSAPQALISGRVVPSVQYISMNLKSINSVHVAFLYNNFETNVAARKLHFVSHNLTSLQLLNGTQLIPQYAIEGNAGTSRTNAHVPFLVELLKSWNKMHDPKTDGAIQAYNFCGDDFCGQFDDTDIDFEKLGDFLAAQAMLSKLVNKQCNVGRCQYGISLEGEELGTDKTMITGRKSQYPFLLQMKSAGKVANHTSYMLTFLRADYIVYIRPDLQIVTLGK